MTFAEFKDGFYLITLEPEKLPRWLLSIGYLAEMVPPYRRGTGINFRIPRRRGFQLGWGRSKNPFLDVTPEDIRDWQPPSPREVFVYHDEV